VGYARYGSCRVCSGGGGGDVASVLEHVAAAGVVGVGTRL
jgi:hypothetical protein